MKKKRGNINYSDIIESDKYLTEIYQNIYLAFKNIANQFTTIQNNVLEIGAGDFSPADLYFPNVIKTDLVSGSVENLQKKVDSSSLPFDENFFDVIIAKDVIHHFKKPLVTLQELSRVMKPNGVMIVSEPYWSLFGRFIFRFLHPEKWDVKVKQLNIESDNPWDSNQALLYLITSRFCSEFAREVPSLQIKILQPTYGLIYAFSGGVFSRTWVPSSFLIIMNKIELRYLKVFKKLFALNTIAIFVKDA